MNHGLMHAAGGRRQRAEGENSARRYAKTASAGVSQSRIAPTCFAQTAAVLGGLLALFLLTLGASTAFAGTVTDRPLLFTFDGSDTSAGAFANATAIDIDQASGAVYVVDAGRNVLDKFNLSGAAQNFSATGTSSLSTGLSFNQYSDVAIDNSSANPGRIYVMPEYGPLKAFGPSGTSLWTLGGFEDVCGLAVDAAGHPWVGDYTNSLAREYATSGTPPAQTGSISTAPGRVCRLDLDSSGNLYSNDYGSTVRKYVGGTATTIDPGSSNGVTVDQSSATGHVFTLHNDGFNEYNASGALLGTYGAGTIGGAGGIAYDRSNDRVYVSDSVSRAVEVFGPVTSGTVPDVTTESATEVGVNKATFHGKVNPQGVPNSYHFEWKEGSSSPWGSAQSSPPFTLPEDSSDHPVSYAATSLGGAREYQVRLVGVNTENGLQEPSSPVSFSTQAASAPPTVASPVVSAVTTTTAHVSGAVDTQEDRTDWNVQISTDPACATGFKDLAGHTIPGGHTGSDSLSEDLTELLPDEHYCVRIRATNSAGTTTSSATSFSTEDVMPTDAFTAFAGPRSATTARLNGYVNPQGSEATYRFEYSQDGSNWTTLPDQTTRRAREQILVGEELTGLSPNTTYHYRFSVENGAGLAEGDERTFTTRTSAEMQLPKRGVELVNQPDKGNQSLFMQRPRGGTPMVAADGNRAIWNVVAGSPGGNSGTYVNYLSTRTPSGWVSRALLPPAAEQVGAGGESYKLVSIAPDFRHFVARASQAEGVEAGPPTYVRLDDNQHQDVLESLASSAGNESVYDNVESTNDGSHVLVWNFETDEVEDIGSGTPEIVSIMPDGTPSACGAEFTGVGGPSGVEWKHGYNRMASTDASRLYFEAVPNGEPCNTGPQAIFYRDRTAEQTVEVDPGSTSQPVSAMIRATPDGRSLYFITKVSHVVEDTNGAADIYRWDAEGDQYTCLTCVVADPGLTISPASGNGPEAVLISNDFSHIYFLSNKELVPGYGTEGVQSLYVLSGGEVRFVASVGVSNVTRNGEMSADGNVLVWLQEDGRTQMTSDELASQCPTIEAVGEPICHEFYRYEDSTGSLECISCAPGRTTVNMASSPGVLFDQALSADGSTVAFTTKEPLVPEDINGTYDVYEWRNGAIGLVSDGETVFPAVGIFSPPKAYGIDAKGENIFFSLIEPGLTGYEQDRFSNLYDARIGGGFPRPQPPEHCSEESCQGPLQTPPAPSSSDSEDLSGAGNVAPARKDRCAGKRGKPRSRCLHKRKHHRKKRTPHRSAQRSVRGAK